MSDDIAIALSDLVGDNPERNISSIKNAVIAQIRESDSGVVAETTDYFNNTYAPDIVLHWPAGKIDRRLYLRTYSNPGYLMEDVRHISSNQPILMSLTPLIGNSPDHPDAGSMVTQREQLWEGSAQASTLVADPATFSALSEERHSHTIGRVLSRAILQGGRGLLDNERTRDVGGAIDRAFNGAQQADVESTRAGVQAADDLLAPDNARQMTSLFQALWLGSGAPATTFPVPAALQKSLDSAILEVLLDLEVEITEDSDFWRRLGFGLTLERLCEIQTSSRSANLQRLVNANIDRLRARSCQVNEIGGSKDEVNDVSLTWFLRSGLLGLASSRYQAFFSATGVSQTDFPPQDRPRSVGILDILSRARESGVEIGELEFEAAGGRLIDYKAMSGADVSDDTLLENIGNAIGKQLAVRAVAVLLAGDRQLRCDLESRHAAGNAGAKYYLTELISKALPLLRPMLSRELSALASLGALDDQ